MRWARVVPWMVSWPSTSTGNRPPLAAPTRALEAVKRMAEVPRASRIFPFIVPLSQSSALTGTVTVRPLSPERPAWAGVASREPEIWVALQVQSWTVDVPSTQTRLPPAKVKRSIAVQPARPAAATRRARERARRFMAGVVWVGRGCVVWTVPFSGAPSPRLDSPGPHAPVGALAPGVCASPSHDALRSEEHTSELQLRENLVCRLLLEKKKEAIVRCN